MLKILTGAVMVIAGMSGVAFANDSMAEMSAGGLIYTYSDSVEMFSEDLYISVDEISVDYVFKNHSDKDITTIVVFPMPDIIGDPYESVSIPFPNEDNLMGFTVRVDNKPIVPNIEQKAFALGLDVTNILLSASVPLLPYSKKTRAKLTEILSMPAGGQDYIEGLIKRGIVENDRYDAGDGEKDHPTPIWTLKSSYWWEMTFPANSSTKVSHKYVPAVGGTAFVSFLSDEGKPYGSYEYYEKRFCMDEAFINAMKREMAKGFGFYESNVSYILKTAQHWYGSIETFRLKIDKGSTKNFVSFCGENIKKIAPTVFEMVSKNFVPDENFNVLIMQRITEN